MFRKLLFALVATVLGLVALEMLAYGVESIWPMKPLRPLPAPGQAECMPECMPDVAGLPQQPTGLPRGIPMAPHGRRAWALAPNTEMVETNVRVRVNDLALRGPALQKKTADEVRILTLGDSSVFGFGVEENAVFGAVAATKLSDAWGKTVVSVNGGTPGYTSVQALHTLQDVGRVVEPDFVVIAALWSDLFQTETPIERSGGQKHPSAFYRLSVRALAPYLPAATVGWIQGDVGAEAPGRAARVGLERYEKTLGELIHASKSMGAVPVILLLPAPVDLDPSPLPALIESYRSVLRSSGEDRGLVVVDAPKVFRRKSAGNQDFYDQVHPSTSGHARIGEALAAALKGIEITQ